MLPTMARSSSTTLRAIGSPRILRIRGLADLTEAFVDSGPGEAARLRLHTRESFAVAERIEVEVSFGPLSDEVSFVAVVLDVHSTAAGRPAVELAVPVRERHRIEYVKQILHGTRKASARRHRRVPVDIDVRWSWAEGRYASRARDLSRGGAFIASRCLPKVGARVDVELRPTSGGGLTTPPIRIDAIVSWIRANGTQTGFGVNFKLPDRDTAARLHDMVRECELFPVDDVR